jgi:flagellar hook-associated protein 3 FlgL
MRVPSYTQYKHQTDLLTSQYEKINTIQEKINSGKKLINSSDDPVLAQSIKTTKDYINLLDSFKKNMTMARTRTTQIESSITGSLNEVNRAAELIKTAQNDTLSDNDRLNISKELEGIARNISNYANSRDGNGDYIFSGTKSNSHTFVAIGSNYQYGGSQETSAIMIDNSTSIIYGESGQKIYGDIKLGNGVFMISQGPVPNTGTAETSVGNVSSQSAYVEDTYTISFVTNGSGKLAYQVTGASSGQVIPVPPQTSPGDAPEYKDGDAISFNGINFVMRGKPVIGDQFIVEPSKKQNALDTINQVAELLRKPITTDSERAAFHQKLGELSSSVQAVSKHLTQVLSEVGYRSKELEVHETNHANEMKDQQIILSKYESADEYELISELTQRMTALQLTQQTYVKIQGFFDDLLKSSF